MSKDSLADKVRKFDSESKTVTAITTASGTVINLGQPMKPFTPVDSSKQLERLESIRPVDFPVEPPIDEQ